MGLFSRLFAKKITVKEEDLQSYFCVKHKKSGRKIKLNSKCIVPDGCICIFCHKRKPCDTLNAGTYELNGNSLPIIYKKGGYNKPNKKNYVKNYFIANIWFISQDNLTIDFDLDKFVVKDRVYGKQKIDFSFRVTLKITDSKQFLKSILFESPRLSTRNVINKITGWLRGDIKKFLKRQGYNIDDYSCYTKGFQRGLNDLLNQRFATCGIEILETILEDIQMPDELLREIADNRNLSLKIHSSIKDFEMAMNDDGYVAGVNFERSSEQTEGSILQSNQDNNIEMDFDDEQLNNNYQSNIVNSVNNFNGAESNSYYNSNYSKIIDSINNNAQTSFENNYTLSSEYKNNNTQYIDDGSNQPNSQNDDVLSGSVNDNDDLEDMYNMADENMNKDAYATLYGSNSSLPSGTKTCKKCNKEVPNYVSFCPYCGNDIFKHNL